MKKLFTLLILLFGVLGTLMAETYTQKVTVYAPATCTTTDIVFYGYKNKSDKSPYKTVSGQPTSMYMNGVVLYKAEIPFNDVVYVKCTYKTNTGDKNSEFSNEITQTCSRYCGLDFSYSMPYPAWYNTFDEAKYNQELFDLNYKANEGTLYVVYDKGYHSTISVYSSEYGEQYKKDISANTVAEYSLLGNTLLAYTVADYEVYDRVIHNYESTFTIDWNKPFYYDGVWYAKLSDIPIKNLLKEESCYRIVPGDRIATMYHIGDNIYSCSYYGLYYFNKDSETKFECKTNCGASLATMNVELKQYGYYTLEFTYNANTNKIECKSELQQADKYIIRAFDYSSIYNAPQMELVGENEYSFSLTTTRDKGLYYYNIDFVDYNGYTSERIKDKLIQIQETGTYDITITYNAETRATSCTVNKADPLAPIYLRGTVNNWGVDERYKLTTTDGNYYVATYTKGNEVEIGDVNGGTAEFKIGSGNSGYTPINFGGSKVIERGGSYRLTSKGVNLKVNGSLKVSKIEFWLSENKLTITPAVQDVKKIYYVNKWGWYNVDYINVKPQDGISDYFSMNKESVTYQGYEVYSYELPTYYSTVYFDGYGEYGYSYTTTIALDFTKPYYYDGVWYETLTFDTAGGEEGGNEGGEEGGDNTGGDDEGGDDNGNDNTGGDNIGGDDDGGEVTPPTPTVFDTTTDQGVAFVVSPNSANAVYVPLTYSYNAEYNTAQYNGEYTVTEYGFTAKIGGLTNLEIINYGTNGEVLTPYYLYMPTKGASEGFTIAGDYKVGDILKIFVTLSSDWYAHVIINVIPTLAPTENDITLYYVNVDDWSTVYGYVWPTGGVGLLEWPGSPATKIDKTVDGYDVYSYTFDSSVADRIIFNNGNGGVGNQTDDLTFEASKPYFYDGVWYETLTFDGEQGGGDTPVVPDPTPEPEGLAFFVAGNGGSDATGIWCNGIEWSSVGVETANNMTDADKDGIYEITFNQVPAGTWSFKVVAVTEGNMSWMGSDFLDTTNSSTGYTTAPYDGNIGFTLTQAANVTVKYNTATGKIILTTPSGSFGKVKIDYFAVANTDECYVENIFEANNNTLKYTVDIQVNEESGYGYAVFRILGNCNYAVYENSLLVGVTESGKYEVTIVFNGDYETPEFTITYVKQGSTIDPDTPVNPGEPDTPVKPEPEPEPVVAIRELTLQPFERILPKTSTSTVATFILENASTATVSLEGNDADFFEIGEQNIAEGECSVQIMFNPFVKGVYYATLTVTTDDNVSLSIDFAAVAGDVSFDPGDVPELNPDPVNPETPEDNPNVSVEEVSAVVIYAKEGTVYSEVDFEIYDLAGVNVTSLNGALKGVYVVKTTEGNRLISVW